MEIGLVSFFAMAFVIGLIIWFISFLYFSRQIRKQTQKMVQLMKADEDKLARPDDVFNSESDLFSDLERASYTLRRKYLRLKKNSHDEKSVFETVFSGLEEAIVTVDPQLKIISFLEKNKEDEFIFYRIAPLTSDSASTRFLVYYNPDD